MKLTKSTPSQMKAKQYEAILRDFLSGQLSVEEFSTIYTHVFKNELEGMNETLFSILEDLFEDIDAYSPLWTWEDENAFRITEDTLRVEVASALKQLESYMIASPHNDD